jgi:hypothetical protein
VPLSGGEESKVLPSVHWWDFAISSRGIYYVPDTHADRSFSIRYRDFATGNDRTLWSGSVAKAAGLALSPDGSYLLFAQVDRFESDLFLVENFR